jgi:hypothetical protein
MPRSLDGKQHGAAQPASVATGTVNSNVLPRPGSLWMEIVPPWLSTIRLQATVLVAARSILHRAPGAEIHRRGASAGYCNKSGQLVKPTNRKDGQTSA